MLASHEKSYNEVQGVIKKSRELLALNDKLIVDAVKSKGSFPDNINIYPVEFPEELMEVFPFLPDINAIRNEYCMSKKARSSVAFIHYLKGAEMEIKVDDLQKFATQRMNRFGFHSKSQHNLLKEIIANHYKEASDKFHGHSYYEKDLGLLFVILRNTIGFCELISRQYLNTLSTLNPDIATMCETMHEQLAGLGRLGEFEKMNGEAYSYSYHGPTYEYHSLSRDNSGYKVEPDDMVLDGKTVGSRMLASMYK